MSQRILNDCHKYLNVLKDPEMRLFIQKKLQ